MYLCIIRFAKVGVTTEISTSEMGWNFTKIAIVLLLFYKIRDRKTYFTDYHLDRVDGIEVGETSNAFPKERGQR